ncbi:MAG: DUF1422 family protein [Vibrionaceae bacterium]
MTQRISSERKSLLLAAICGASLCASWAGLFTDAVSFSLFPLTSLLLAASALYDLHKQSSLLESLPILLSCFLVGIFGQSAFIRMEQPELGSNFISIMATMLLTIWIYYKTSSSSSSSDPSQ